MNSACTIHVFKNIKNGFHNIIHTFKAKGRKKKIH